MSVLHPFQITCQCGEEFEAELYKSINIDRLPQERERILQGTFHQVTCPGCHQTQRVEKEFLYLDFGRNTIIRVIPNQLAQSLQTIVKPASEAFRDMFQQLPRFLPKIEGSLVRLVCGVGELREKLIGQDQGWDDRLVEMLKIVVSKYDKFVNQSPLRIYLDHVTSSSVEFVVIYGPTQNKCRLNLSRQFADQILNRTEEMKKWITKNCPEVNNIFAAGDGFLVNIWRWTSRSSAIERNSHTPFPGQLPSVIPGGVFGIPPFPGQISDDIEDLVITSVPTIEINRLFVKPTLLFFPNSTKQKLFLLFRLAKALNLEKKEAALFEIRFGFKLEKDWVTNQNLLDVEILWIGLDGLPDTAINTNDQIHEINLNTNSSEGFFHTSNHEIDLGETELANPAAFQSLVRHEVAHSLQEKLDAQDQRVSRWLKEQFGWQTFKIEQLDSWIELMGGWQDLSVDDQEKVKLCLSQALGPGKMHRSSPITTSAKTEFPWSNPLFGPRQAKDRTGSPWYANNQNWYRFHPGENAFFLNYFYCDLTVVRETTLDFINLVIISKYAGYAAMSPSEFFAELFAWNYNPGRVTPTSTNGAMTTLIAEIKEWFDQNVGPARS